MNVYEGDERDGRDITFTYNANFFLFATLENARPIAHGRVPQQQQNQPVLTGTPVAGMAYLERPHQAGYFIFPDLSVRHEGKYRLAFTLFEEVKDPKDADLSSESAGNVGTQVHGRCEVKSSPFNVYSAKKFPGLTESTPLSRLVADQGCRVRIRRDVRMRRRSEKDPKEWDHYEDATADQRDKRSASPESHTQPSLPQGLPSIDPSTDRTRSVSDASNLSNHPPPAPRRSSAQEMPQQHPYQAGYLAHPMDLGVSQQQVQPPPHSSSQQAVGAFGPTATIPASPSPASTLASQSHVSPSQQASSGYLQQAPYESVPYHAQQYVATQPMPAYQQQPAYTFSGPANSGMAPTAQPHPPQQQQQVQPMGPPNYGYVQPGAGYEGSVAQVRPQESMEYLAQQPSTHAPYHRGSMSSQFSNSSHPASPLGPEESGFGRTSLSSMSIYNHSSQPRSGMTTSNGKGLPPLQSADLAVSKSEVSSPLTVGGFEASARPAPPMAFSRRAMTGKRSYGSTFNTQHIQEPLRAGARPNTTGGALMTSADASDGSDEDLDLDALRVSYRRADGSRVQRSWSRSAL